MADPQGKADHLRQHQFTVEGSERLSKKPLAVRLYASDDELVRAKGKDAGAFVRDAVRDRLRCEQEGQATPEAK